MSQAIIDQVEKILKDIIYDRYDDLPDNSTRAMIVAIRRKFPSFEVIVDSSYYEEGLFVSSVQAKIDGGDYVVKMCYDAGSTLCYPVQH